MLGFIYGLTGLFGVAVGVNVLVKEQWSRKPMGLVFIAFGALALAVPVAMINNYLK